MKIVLSRKGFDSGFGGQASPILPDGTLLSLPIPSKYEDRRFSELYYKDKSYYQIIKELNPKTAINENYTCHVDPDIRYSTLKRAPEWKPIFGQSDSALGHLVNNQVEVNDIFLFFGWFKQTQLIDGKYEYIKNAPDIHIIYGYLQIGEIYSSSDNLPEYARYHPHAGEGFITKTNNCIFIASPGLSLNEDLPGSAPLMFNSNLILTKNGMSRSKWELPSIFKDLNISYHSRSSFKENYFQSAAKGQEFVINANADLTDWATYIINQKVKS